MSIKQSGQTAVFVFILLLVGLTIGLSLATRTIKDLQSSTNSDQSSRAFAAAEAGVEEALRQNLATITASGTFSAPEAKFPTDNLTTYSYTVAKSPTFTQTVAQDNSVQINLSGFSGTLNVYWVSTADTTENTSGSRASLELTEVKNNAGVFTLSKYAVNADPRSNNFTPTGASDGPVTNLATSDDTKYHNKLTVSVASSDNAVSLRLRPLYNKTTINVTGSGLPSQSYVITSRGVAGNTATRVVQVTKAIPSLPAIFDYVLFNGSTNPLSK